MIPLAAIDIILHHADPDGGLAALVLRRAIQRRHGRVLPLIWADYHSQSANNLHELAVENPRIYTVDVRLRPGVPGMDHHDSSQPYYEPNRHILDLTAESCFGLMLDELDQRGEWPPNIVQHIDWLDAGTYPSAELAVGLDQPGQYFVALLTSLEFEQVLAELWREPDPEAFVRRHQDRLEEIRRHNELLRRDIGRRGRREGRVAIWDSSHVLGQHDIRQSAVNPFLLCAAFPRADYTIRIRPDGHMTIGHNPWAQPAAHIGQLCETLFDPETGIRGGGKAQVGGAPATPETVRRAVAALNAA